MINCYFNNLQNITINELKNATRSVKVAVAWINFEYYAPVFKQLLNLGVKVKILLNDDANNKRYLDDINTLCSCGAKIRLVRYSGIMHHKFCVIDNQRCLFGSFNWTHSANIRNIEDINICDEPAFVYNYLLEFKALWELSQTDIRRLRNPLKCSLCNSPLIDIMLMEEDGVYNTKIDVKQQCSCGLKELFADYFDISVYTNYIGIIDQFDNQIMEAQQSGDESLYNQLASQQDFTLSCYLSTVRHNRMGCPIIHAVGIKTWEWLSKDDGYWCYKIIWKERGVENYIENEYPI